MSAVESERPLPIWLVNESTLTAWLGNQDESTRQWLSGQRFRADRQQLALLPSPRGAVAGAVLGLGSLPNLEELDLWHCAGLPDRLPAGLWRFADPLSASAATAAVLGWNYGQYRFDRYRSAGKSVSETPQLAPPDNADLALVAQQGAAITLARDLINTPAVDLGPTGLAAAAMTLAGAYGAAGNVVAGRQLQVEFPAIHAVGRAAVDAPRLIDFSWGDPQHPRVTLVGKGVCFDSGGLDIKPAAGMLLMKKDMGGAACVLALARMVMAAALPVRLRVLIPAVENAISGDAMRPGDVLRTRKGITVEVGNTDAEGRLVLCDALAAAEAESPDLLIDLATLTGAARVALGTELPAIFGNRAETVDAIVRHGRALADPLWPMPLWGGYEDEFSSRVADINNVSASGFAGAIIAALYLRRFVGKSLDWIHIDLYAWNGKERPGRPVGGEAQTVRALFAYLTERYRR